MLRYFLYFVCLSFTCLAFFLQISPQSESQKIHQLLNLTPSFIVYITSLFFIAYAVMQIPNGILLDTYGVKILPIYISITLLGIIVFWIYPSPETLAIRRVMTGIGCSIAFLASIYIASRVFSIRRRTFFIALVSVSSSLGAVLSTRAYSFVFENFGWNGSFLFMVIIISLILFASIVIISLYKPIKKYHARYYPFFKKCYLIFHNRTLLSVYSYTFFTWMIIMAFAGYWAKNYFVNMHHYTANNSLGIVQFFWISYMLSSIVISFFIKTQKQCSKVIKILAAVNVVTLLFFIIPIPFSSGLLVATACLCGIATAGIALGFSIISSATPSGLTALAVSINNTILVLGGFLGQIIFGLFIYWLPDSPITLLPNIEIIENYYFALLFLPVCAILAFLSVNFGLKSAPKNTLFP